MASLTVFQVLELSNENSEHPTISSISGDALTLIVASTLNLVHVYARDSVSENFVKKLETYDEHSSSEKITALAIQDSGVHAASGDTSGTIHIWRTDDPKERAKYKLNKGRVTAISISTKFILACFTEGPMDKRKILLLNKGLNIKEKLVVEKEFDGDVSSDICSVSEYGKPVSPFLMYVCNGNLVFECPLHENKEMKTKLLPQGVIPWCIRRNNGAANLFVVSSASLRDLILWAPLHGEGKGNPITLRMSSQESLRLNTSLVMSSVVTSSMFMASIYEKKVNVLKVLRKKQTNTAYAKRISNPRSETPVYGKDGEYENTKKSDEKLESEKTPCPIASPEATSTHGNFNDLPAKMGQSLDTHSSQENVNQVKFGKENAGEISELSVHIVKTKLQVERQPKGQDEEIDTNLSNFRKADDMNSGTCVELKRNVKTAGVHLSNGKLTEDVESEAILDSRRNSGILTEGGQNGFGTEELEDQAAFDKDYENLSDLYRITSHKFWDLFYEENDIKPSDIK